MASVGSCRDHSRAAHTTVAALAAIASALIVPALAGAEESAPTELSATPSSRVREHSLGFGYHTVIMHTDVGDTYVLHGPSLVYDYFIGRRWGFALRTALFFPVLGTMSGPSGDFSGSLVDAYDQRHIGYDALAMAARRLPLTPGVVLTAGFGLHIQGFALNGAAYSPVEEDSIGVGGVGKVDWLLNEWLSCSAQLAIGVDFLDIVSHDNPARLVLPLSGSFAFAARY
jgi:hypothetical protein